MSKLAIVCGGRDWGMYASRDASDPVPIPAAVDLMKRTFRQNDVGFVIEGEANGADRIAGLAADELGIPYVKVPALWNRYGKSAGYKRNALMLKMLKKLGDGREICVIAFPGGRGTAMMKTLAEGSEVPVITVNVTVAPPEYQT